jgi:hypothetical protein
MLIRLCGRYDEKNIQNDSGDDDIFSTDLPVSRMHCRCGH